MEETPPEQQLVLVTVVASKPLRTRSGTLVMYADFGDGLRYQLGAGANPVRIPPGVHHLQLYSLLAPRWRVARAAITVDTRTGPLTVYYATPYTIPGRGRAGFVPKRRPVRSVLIAAAAGTAFAALWYILGWILTS
jgi:hypothetical protein